MGCASLRSLLRRYDGLIAFLGWIEHRRLSPMGRAIAIKGATVILMDARAAAWWQCALGQHFACVARQLYAHIKN